MDKDISEQASHCKTSGNTDGKRKGSPEKWVAVVKPGRILFELAGVTEEVAREALRLAAHKLPIKTKFVVRQGAGGEPVES